MSSPRQLRSLCGSFKVAFSGIVQSIKNERNLRIHISIALGVLFIAPFYRLERATLALLVLLFAAVITAELFNTAIEAVVDLLSPSYNHLAKLAKDIAAGAVLVTAVAAVAVGFLLFCEPQGMARLFRFIQEHPVVFLGGAALYAAFAVSFIFVPAHPHRVKGPRP